MTYENVIMDVTKYNMLFRFLVHSFHRTTSFIHSQDLS